MVGQKHHVVTVAYENRHSIGYIHVDGIIVRKSNNDNIVCPNSRSFSDVTKIVITPWIHECINLNN